MTDIAELVKNTVTSSRVRLARNVEGLPFPQSGRSGQPERMLSLVKGAQAAAERLFECELCLMSDLKKAQKTALVERHIISLPLANNNTTGAVILQHDGGGLSVMLNEEDHIREQYVCDGLAVGEAYRRLNVYDDELIRALPIAYDKQFGFLTACPTNLGTGMRASVMLFLPALKLNGGIEDALKRFINDYGLTVRGVYGEGSAADGDLYQISNTRTLGVTEAEIIDVIERAAAEMCLREQAATERLVRRQGAELLDKIWRSYGVLLNAYKLSSAELFNLVSDVKLGVRLSLLPVKDMKKLDGLALLCSAASLSLKIGERSPEERDILRAKLVRNVLSEEI